MTYLMAAILAILVVETWLLWRALSNLGMIERIDDRLARLSHTMLLLTDATETCFHTLAGRLEPAAAEPATRGAAKPADPAPAPAAAKAGRTRRVVGAARRGRSALEIAAAEEVSESEVRLRLHLAGHNQSKKEGRRGALRS